MAALTEIAPTEQQRIIDLVRDAGIDVSGWSNFKGSNPATNPRYCYEWAFSNSDGTAVLNLWFDKMKEEGDSIVYRMNLREDAERVAASRQAQFSARARRMDGIVRRAYQLALPVRVIACSGSRHEVDDAESSTVKKRKLDPAYWAITTYNDATGECVLIRGIIPPRIVDQFILAETEAGDPKRRTTVRNDFSRSREVRAKVLRRSRGKCEHCHTTGFVMPDGSIFLETHHVVLLSDGGLDSETNVVALCPNHHREAHYGRRRVELQTALLAFLQCQ